MNLVCAVIQLPDNASYYGTMHREVLPAVGSLR